MMTKAKGGGKYVSSILAKDRVATRRIRRGDHAWSDGYVGRVHRRKSLPRSNKIIYTTPRGGFSKAFTREQPDHAGSDLGYSVVRSRSRAISFILPNGGFCVRHAAEVIGLRGD